MRNSCSAGKISLGKCTPKCSLALMKLPATILSVGAGLGYVDAGSTHYANKDIACLHAIVGLEVLSPCDAVSTKNLAMQTWQSPRASNSLGV